MEALQSKLLIAVKASMTGAQSINSGVATTLNLPSESYDTNGMHDNAVNNSQLIFSQQADFATQFARVIAYMEFAANATQFRRIDVRLNAGSFVPLISVLAAASNPTRLCGDRSFSVQNFSINDALDMQGTQRSGIALNVNEGFLALSPVSGGPADNLKTFLAKAILSGTQSIANNDTTQNISFTSTELDNCPIYPAQSHWSAASPTRITIRQSGRYMVLAWLTFAVNATGDRGGEIRLNGVTRISAQMIKGANAVAHNATVAGVGSFVAGDFLELFAYQNSGAPLNCTYAELCIFGECAANQTDQSGVFFHY